MIHVPLLSYHTISLIHMNTFPHIVVDVIMVDFF